MGFFEYICMPLFSSASACFPELTGLREGAAENYALWSRRFKEEEQAATTTTSSGGGSGGGSGALDAV